MDATVAIIVTASHYEEYVETSEEARSSYKWVPWSGGGPPSGAVCGGEDQGGPVYVARAHHQGGLTPGKFHAKYKTAFISWGGQEHEKPRCEVLVGRGLSWEHHLTTNWPQQLLCQILHLSTPTQTQLTSTPNKLLH